MTRAQPVYVAAIDLSCKAFFFSLMFKLMDFDSSLGLYVFCCSYRVFACSCCDFAMALKIGYGSSK